MKTFEEWLATEGLGGIIAVIRRAETEKKEPKVANRKTGETKTVPPQPNQRSTTN